MFITTLRSTRVLGMINPIVQIETTWFLGSSFFSIGMFPEISSATFPIKSIVGGSLFFFLGIFRKSSLNIFSYISISLMAWRKGIFAQIFQLRF